MVKNTVGGGKSKKIARKLTTTTTVKESTRFSTNELEEYALVKKIYGNGRCQVKTHSGLDIHCVIRNKFKGRSKRGNVVTNGTYILVGLREWETGTGYKTCDLLEIYDKEDVVILQSQPPFKTLLENTNEKYTNDGLFSTIEEINHSITSTPSSSHIHKTATEETSDENEKVEDVFFDDI